MPQSLAQIYVHLVLSTKGREPLLVDGAFRKRTHAYLAGICRQQDCPAVAIGGVADHVHLLARLGRAMDVSTLVRELKRDSTKWIKENEPRLRGFHWQAGYGAFSVSASHADAVAEYIGRQEEHHRTVTFQDELRRICQKYGIDLDERYAWD